MFQLLLLLKFHMRVSLFLLTVSFSLKTDAVEGWVGTHTRAPLNYHRRIIVHTDHSTIKSTNSYGRHSGAEDTVVLSPVRNLFLRFDQIISNPRIDRSNQVAVPLPNRTQHALPLPMVSSDHLELAPQIMMENGGWCIIELQDKGDINAMEGMWQTIETHLFPLEADSSTSNSEELQLHHQILSSVPTADENTTGYAYTQVCFADDSFATLSRAVGSAHGNHCLRAYQVVAKVSSAIVSAAWKQTMPTDEQFVDSTLIHQLVNEGNITAAGSSQRLACYANSSGTKEFLRSHGDWSLVTVVPVSSMPGLEVYNRNSDGLSSWVCPETQFVTNGQGKGRQQESPHHARYLCCLSGKWLEILTLGRISTTLHRVVHAPNRLSAPFFLRPALRVLNHLEEAFVTTDQALEQEVENLQADIHRLQDTIQKWCMSVAN